MKNWRLVLCFGLVFLLIVPVVACTAKVSTVPTSIPTTTMTSEQVVNLIVSSMSGATKVGDWSVTNDGMGKWKIQGQVEISYAGGKQRYLTTWQCDGKTIVNLGIVSIPGQTQTYVPPATLNQPTVTIYKTLPPIYQPPTTVYQPPVTTYKTQPPVTVQKTPSALYYFYLNEEKRYQQLADEEAWAISVDMQLHDNYLPNDMSLLRDAGEHAHKRDNYQAQANYFMQLAQQELGR